MSTEIFKATAMAKELKQRLAFALPIAAIAESKDSLNYPVMTITYSGFSLALVIRHDSDGNQRIDGIGLPQVNYTPHEIDMVMGEIVGDALPAATVIAVTMSVAHRCGSPIVLRVGTAGNATELVKATFDALPLAYRMEYDELNPITSQM